MVAARTTPSTLLFDVDWQNPKIGVDGEGLANQDCIISNLKAVLRNDTGANKISTDLLCDPKSYSIWYSKYFTIMNLHSLGHRLDHVCTYSERRM